MHIALLWCYSGKTDVGIESVAIGDFSAQAERGTVAETWILVWKMIVTALVPLIKVSLRYCLGTIRMAFKIYFFTLTWKSGFTRNKCSIFSTDCISYRKITTIYYLYFCYWAQLSWGGSSLFHVLQAELPDISAVSSLVVNLATGSSSRPVRHGSLPMAPEEDTLCFLYYSNNFPTLSRCPTILGNISPLCPAHF